MSVAPGSAAYARVIVEVEPDHLDRPFDYRIPDEHRGDVTVGSRVEVVFAGRRVRALVVGLTDEPDVEESRARDIRRPLGGHIWVRPDEIELLRWAARRYASPMAAVVRHALPNRVVSVERRAEDQGWFPTAERASDPPPPAVDPEAWAAYRSSGDGPTEVLRAGTGEALYCARSQTRTSGPGSSSWSA